nr:odorant receptor 58.2 [Papilio glaucus]
MIGLRLTHKDSSITKFFWNGFYLFECINLFVALILDLVNMVLTVTDGSFIDLVTMMPCVGYTILCIVKSCKLFFHQPVYERLISELRDMWPRCAVTREEHDVVRTAITKLKFTVKGYYYCNVALFFIFVSPPFVAIIKRATGLETPLRLSFSYWFPFDPFQHGHFEVIAVIQMWHCFVTLCFMLATDLLFCVFISHITTQFDLLAIKIKRMFYVPLDDQLIGTYPLANYNMNSKHDIEPDGNNELEKKYEMLLVEIILSHRTLIRLSRDVEQQFTFALLINFINGSIIICFCGYCSVFVEKWNEFNYKIFLITATLQIWIFCSYGQKLLDSSEGIADAVYCCGWYNAPQRIKRSLIIILYRAQRQVCITTYGFSVISMASYSTILKTSWSYLMLLVNVFEQ